MIELNTIHNGDCLDVMKNIADGSIDMILSDLPYGHTNCKWDFVIPPELLWQEYRRISKENAAIVLTATQPFATSLIASNQEMFKYDLIWNKNLPCGFLNAKKQFMRSHELVLVFYKKQPTYNPQFHQYAQSTMDRYEEGEKMKLGKHIGQVYRFRRANKAPFDYKRGRYPGSVLNIKCVHNGNFKRLHSTQKPVELFSYLIRTFSNSGDTVLDSCAGSGTTAISCIETGRNYICIEKDLDIFNKMKNRIKNENRKLFTF